MLRANWRESVDEIERGLKACLESLDRYEQQFHTVLAEPTSPSPDPAQVIPPKSDGWAERLATAGERAASVERLLDEQQQVWQQFQTAIQDWKQTHRLSPVSGSRVGE